MRISERHGTMQRGKRGDERCIRDYLILFDKETQQEKLGKLTEKEIEALTKQLLTQIQFFQHERFIHLIVMSLFAVIAIIVLIAMVYFKALSMLILFEMLLVLLFPYIIHYYHLENGTQKLYTYYDRIMGEKFGDKE